MIQRKSRGSHEEIAEESEEEQPKVDDVIVDPAHDVSKERERSVSASGNKVAAE